MTGIQKKEGHQKGQTVDYPDLAGKIGRVERLLHEVLWASTIHPLATAKPGMGLRTESSKGCLQPFSKGRTISAKQDCSMSLRQRF